VEAGTRPLARGCARHLSNVARMLKERRKTGNQANTLIWVRDDSPEHMVSGKSKGVSFVKASDACQRVDKSNGSASYCERNECQEDCSAGRAMASAPSICEGRKRNAFLSFVGVVFVSREFIAEVHRLFLGAESSNLFSIFMNHPTFTNCATVSCSCLSGRWSKQHGFRFYCVS
jgi:hypothetical protein